jgi:FtsH-binding integral membrane protein
MNQTTELTAEQIQAEQSRFITKVYAWMTFALIITGAVSIWCASTPSMIEFIFGNSLIFWGLIIAEFICVAVLVSTVSRISSNKATLIFIGYSALNGLTLSGIFLIYTSQSIASTFFVTAITFGVMSTYGYFTKRDLTSVGNLATMALVGIFIASIVNIFLGSETLYWIITYVGVLIFVALIARDTQKIKELNIIGNEGTEQDKKEAIMGALTLYLDFINLFLFLLRLLGRRK